MIIQYYGPFIYIHINPNELSQGIVKIPLKDGYSYEELYIHNIMNIGGLNPYMTIHAGDDISFPVVNSKSPSILPLYVSDVSKMAEIRPSIEKFGQIPDPHYFDKAFEPILVVGDDGKEYKVIPSDQFK